ncbi:MAG: hypothetical protein HN657_01600 [Candidatus Marinimicrobia bacterium]|jgi:aminopeptidase N|nr:hypothetical protein [Candidatus Neomarinimicrobiota bacterium]MBT3496434.1 hypothetical protein [Candidatus Neomarinimicrobiota bacterium]MBT3692675.1 hypothetical protein [Candidatus Neomarinimicrobiota bacterium]MBT3732587.1 hypothetical protein [Candidatus Neomarinimicrobiota bacterium]MBT4144696.1 hypothetical protein [Candidatus Neomarinimicrobiota bacterium]
MKIIVCALILINLIFAVDLPPENFTPDRSYDVQHSRIEVEIHFETKSISGDVTHTIQKLDSKLSILILDADDMDISIVSVKNKPKDFYQADGKVYITLDNNDWTHEMLTIALKFDAYPKSGLYFIKPDSVYPNKHLQAWTQGEDQDNHHWVPLYDYPNDKATFECIITVPDSLIAISNGELISETNNSNGTKTFHWRENYPMVSYLISFVVGNYEKVEDNFEDLPVSYWVYPENKHEAMRSFGKTPDMISFFNEKTGVDYPYEKYDQVIIEDFMFGGMENITLTHNTDRTMYDKNASPDVSSDGLVAHELAHQWYGDLLTTRNWENIWLNEGFATFFSREYRRKDLGDDEADYIRFGEMKAYLANDKWNRRPTVYHRYYASMDLFDSHVYAKGALILSMIENVLGEELFWKAIQKYTSDNKYRNVETSDFKKAIEETTGKNLNWFFDEWVYKAGYPEFEISWTYSNRTKMVSLEIKQIQELKNNSLFKMPVTIMIDNEDIVREEIWIEGTETKIQIPSEKRPRMVLFDEGQLIPKKITFKKSVSELIYQLKNAPNVLDRIGAAHELKTKKSRRKVVDALIESINHDSFWGVRKEAVIALAQLKPKKGSNHFREASKQQDNRVKRECVKALKQYKNNDESILFLENIIKTENNYYLIADAFSTLTALDSNSAKQFVETLLNRESHNDVIRKSAIQYFGKIESEKNFQRLIELAEYGGTSWTARSTAVNELGKYVKAHPELLEKFVKWLDDPDYYVRIKAAQLLGKYGSEKHKDALDQLAYRYPASEKSVRFAKNAIDRKLTKPKSKFEIENEKLRTQLEEIQSVLKK